MQGRSTRFLIDTNVFIAAVKKGWTKTDVEDFLEFMRLRVIIVNPSDEEIKVCKKYFPENEVADAVHAATCLKTNVENDDFPRQSFNP